MVLGSVLAGIACNSESPKPKPTPTRLPSPTPELMGPPTFRNEVLSLTWQDLENPQKREAFTTRAAEQYLYITKSKRFSSQQLSERTKYFFTRNEFLQAIRKDYPDFQDNGVHGVHLPSTSEVLIDFGSSKKDDMETGTNLKAVTLLNGLWHEWLHLDLDERSKGDLFNNKNFILIYKGQEQVWIKGRGITVASQNMVGFTRANETLVSAIGMRFLNELMRFDSLPIGNYFPNGIDVILSLSRRLGMDPLKLYQYHATSDLEGLALAFGQKLPGNKTDLEKGIELIGALNSADGNLIRSTGICPILPKDMYYPRLCSLQ